jgi:D-glycerate 3-kinase
VIENPIPELIYRVIQEQRARHPGRPALIGVAGAQGSGKTHWCRLIEAANRPRFAHFSLDDVYLTKAERERLARDVHPLFATRGAPGTHDLDLALRTIDSLYASSTSSFRASVARPGTQRQTQSAVTPWVPGSSRSAMPRNDEGNVAETKLPRFDKARDDRAPEETWPIFQGRPEAILFDGWCLGALPDQLGEAPLNALEAEEDRDGRWRRAIRAELEGRYAGFFDRFDAIIYLRAPNWEIVRAWRGEQEEKLLGRKLNAEENAKLDRFVMHYERITRSMMEGYIKTDWTAQLDEDRRARSIQAGAR